MKVFKFLWLIEICLVVFIGKVVKIVGIMFRVRDFN